MIDGELQMQLLAITAKMVIADCENKNITNNVPLNHLHYKQMEARSGDELDFF